MHTGIRNLFSELPARYELINHILTFGMDIYWRKKAAQEAVQKNDSFILDVCSGTGDMAYTLRKAAADNTIIIAIDFNPSMLQKASAHYKSGNLTFFLGDALALPFKNNSLDLITISFATRNLNVNEYALIQGFKEFHRVLKPGGRFINLETSQPGSRIVRWLFHRYVKMFVKPIGRIISGSRAGYKYLSLTIPRFYTADKLSELIYTAGFSSATYTKMLFGVTAIHRAVK